MKAFVAAASALVLLAGCAPRRADRVVVGSGATAEQRLLGEVLAQQLQRRTKVQVERRFGLSGALACRRAQGSGKIDVYAEYSLTALTDILRHRAVGDPAAALNLIAREFAERFHVAWLPALDGAGRVAPVVRDDALSRHPEIRGALAELAGALPDSTLSRLVAEVDGQHRDPAAVAREFLAGLGG